ncbi:pyridoxal phosphate-dependent aminotransferase [Nocardioides sp. dk4132]|uniref:pyridoxal phosphate-dependent aminotransferase n=1 Tax=unclassified Nocardioides TaxID=2615069 RepID=UPI00129516A0|nr:MULTISPECIES: pyridoxal phosphate-dependent aminotransferase [unclassified Nocardioides]MQW77379.1 pyridoxal phosphate-dependent aminotransferase [Nocardioides sp. dk4132]QGA09194.1 pyridoxal phosphate-dependent aminotransferase [Nocardioides sp. dk884]
MPDSPSRTTATPRLARRLHGIAPTIFTQMSALAARTGSVNLGQGFPDVDGPPSVIAEAVEALRTGHNQYAPGPGVPALREAVARHQQRHYGLELDPETEVVVTTGCTEAIAAALLGLVDPGDEVIVLEPYYDSYTAMIQMAGGVRRPVTLRAPDFRLDPEELRAAVGPRTRFVLLNSPHNPTGTVLTRAELQAVADVAIAHDLVVITDEVYEHLTFDAEHVPLATLPGMRERTLTLSSAGKSYSFTGWKVGWASGPAELVDALLAAKQWLTFTSGSPLQPAVAHALEEEPDFPRALAADLRGRRDLLCAGLADAGLRVRVPEGTYFATTDISDLGWRDGLEFCHALPERAGVVAVPEQVFHDDQEAGRHLVRWAFCKDPEVLTEGVRRLGAADLTR